MIIKRDFGSIGRLFGIPRAWLSRVGAFCSSWCADGGIIKLYVPDFPDPVKNPIKIGIDEDELSKRISAIVGDGGGGGDSGGGTVKSVDGNTPDNSGDVKLGALTGKDLNKSGGPLEFDPNGVNSTASGSGMQIVTNVSWDAANHRLTLTKRNLRFARGLVVSVGTTSTETIDTATLVSWS